MADTRRTVLSVHVLLVQYTQNVSKDRAILGAERFIILAAVIGLLRLLYSVAQTIILKGWIEVL
jgi:hypothetical protein